MILEGQPKPSATGGSDRPRTKTSDAPSDRPPQRSSPPRSQAENRARRRARRYVMIAYYSVVAAFILLAAGNVTWQVWAPYFRSYAPVDCRAGLRDLTRAIDRARQAAGSF